LKKNVKGALIIAVAAIITVLLAVYIPRSQQVEGKDSYVTTPGTISENTGANEAGRINSGDNLPVQPADTSKSGQAEQYTTREPAEEKDIASQGSSQQADETSEQTVYEDGKTDGNQPNDPVSTSDTRDQSGAYQNGNAANDGKTSNNEDKPVRKYSREWAEKKIQEHKDEIDPDDLENFRYIVGKLGEYRISSKLEGGLSEEEQSELYNYMKATLTEEEFETARQLFAEYNWILYED